MNRKIVMSAFSIVTALTMMAGATFAVFTSAASNNGNTFGAGTLVLNVNGSPTSSTPLFTVSAAKPGDTSTQTITLTNTGSVAISSIKLTSIGHSSTSTPDLGTNLTLELFNDTDNNGTFTPGTDLPIGPVGGAHITQNTWNNLDLGLTLPALTGTHDIFARITFDQNSNDSFQGTNSSFNFNFQASQ